METTSINIADKMVVSCGDEFVNKKGNRLFVDGFTKTYRVRFTFTNTQHGEPEYHTYTRTPDAFLGHIQREGWTRITQC
jgi:hypothetical protein